MISYLENEKIKTVEQVSIAIKIASSQILNSVCVPLALIYAGKEHRAINDTFYSVYSNEGLVSKVFYVALFSLATPVVRFVDPYYIF
jgi:hypothetical protein